MSTKAPRLCQKSNRINKTDTTEKAHTSRAKSEWICDGWQAVDHKKERRTALSDNAAATELEALKYLPAFSSLET
ncbi:MAG: hypothetical protein AB7C98_07255, partial [Acidithiobacillus sp.]